MTTAFSANKGVAGTTLVYSYAVLLILQEDLVDSIEDAGFEGRILGQGGDAGSARLHIDNMICSACSGKIEKALLAQPGVLDASVSLITHKAEVRNISRCFRTSLGRRTASKFKGYQDQKGAARAAGGAICLRQPHHPQAEVQTSPDVSATRWVVALYHD